MATLLLEGPCPTPPPAPVAPVAPPAPVGTATLVLVLSPVRAPDGSWRVARRSVDAGQTIAASLPARQEWARVIWNGGVVPPEQWDTVTVQDGDEVWAIPQVGDPVVTPFLIYAAVGLAVSIAATALTYVLFPPAKPHMSQPPDEHTFSFAGITTAVGPGNVVPVIYGRHRVGGQLLSASVDQVLQVQDAGPGSVYRVSALSEPPRLSMLIALGEGPIESIDYGGLELNGQLVTNYQGVELDGRLGTPDQTAMPFFSETRNTFADGRQLPDNSGNTDNQILYTTTSAVDAVVLNVVFNEGLFNVNGKGEKEDNTVTVSYRLKPFGEPTWPAWSLFDVSAQRTAPVRFGIRRDNLPHAQYDVALAYGNPRHSDELKAKFKPTLENVTEIQNGVQNYPNTALLGIRAVATDALQGALPNVTVAVNGRKVRQGTLSNVEAWTDNPAWAVMDFLTNRRYGLGIPDAEIDLFAFAQWAAYNDEPIAGEKRHTFNYVLDRDTRAQSLLLEMMGGSRTLLLKAGGLWTPRPTRNDPPVQLLSWATCSNLRITYTRDADRINVMEARFANEDAKFEQDVMTWPTVENWPAEVHKASLDIRGVTKPSRIQRALQFELNRRQFENCTIELDNALDATTLQVHDLFRFSHPLPGWGQSGRVQEGSTTTTIFLDEDVSMQAGVVYHLYIRHIEDTTEVRQVFNPGTTTTRRLQFATPFGYQPTPRDAIWAFGQANPDTAMRIFRVVQLQRKNDTTVHIQAVIHNPTIYDDPVASPLPIPPGLFNPLGPPPPLTYLTAMELTRIQPNGMSMRVGHLAWDVADLSAGYAPYAGATVLRRSILDSALAGSALAGGGDLGALQNPADQNVGYTPLIQVKGHVLEVDDYSTIQGGTYIYRVIPVSGRDVPNMAGAREAILHMAGPTTADFFPGTPANLRLRGKAVGDGSWEGRDVHLQWDPVPDPFGLFSSTFFVMDYIVQIWTPGQTVLLYSSTVGLAQTFTYTFEMNLENAVRTGQPGALRSLYFLVFARTNTNRISLDPAKLLATNPPPDMSSIRPDATGYTGGTAVIKWDQFAEPLDFDHYEVHLDLMNPPVAIYQDLAIAFHGVGFSIRNLNVVGLVTRAIYYCFILPYDTFGAGLPSQTVSFETLGLNPLDVDTTPPSMPTGLVLSTGTEMSEDGTVMAWVQAHWTAPPESDVGSYQVDVYIEDSIDPTIWHPIAAQTTIRFFVPGGVRVRVRLSAIDRFGNVSDFTEEAEIVSAGDGQPPAAPTNLTAFPSIRAVALLWTPPPDGDYDYSEVWSAATNNRDNASMVGTGKHSFQHEGLGEEGTFYYYWIRAVDRSGNVSPFHPLSSTAGVTVTPENLATQFIESLAANKITAGILNVLVSIGVNRIFIDGVNSVIGFLNSTGQRYLMRMGKLGALSTEWGLQIFNEAGATMWNFSTGATTEGISDGAINAVKLRANIIEAYHLVTDRAVITGQAQIANAIIGSAKITDVSANLITTGKLAFNYAIGGSPTTHLFLDGPNEQFQVLDGSGALRCVLGYTYSYALGVYGYGLQIYAPGGAIMWDLHSGASSLGIQDLAVTNAKIQDAAITNAKIGNLEVDNAKIANLTVGTGKIAPNAISGSLIHATFSWTITAGTPVELATVTFPELHAGDVVWLVGTGTAVGAGQGGVITNFNLREDNTGGNLHQHTEVMDAAGNAAARFSMAVQAVYPVPSDMFNKTFVLESTGIGLIQNVRLVGLRLQK